MKEDPVAHIPPLTQEAIQDALQDVYQEVETQDAYAREDRFNGTHVMPGGTDLERLAVLAEEAGEVAIEVCKGIHGDGYTRREALLYKELIQTAAVATAWAAAILEGRDGA